jgi:hypothetical protein
MGAGAGNLSVWLPHAAHPGAASRLNISSRGPSQ